MISTTLLGAAAALAASAAIAAGAPMPASVVAPPEANTLTPAETAAGWKLLFDGKTTGDWRSYRKEGFPEKGWAVEDGTLKVIGGGGGGDIITQEQYGDFELQLEWKATPKANSGIIYRVSETKDYPWMTGPEFQVLDDAGHPGLDPKHTAGSLYDIVAAPEGKVLKPAGEWNHARIMIDDGVLRHWVNGVKTVEVRIDDDQWKERIANSKFKAWPGFGLESRGHLALQDHGDTVWYRNIKVRDLDAPMPGEVTLFNGTDTSGWRAVSPEASGSHRDPMATSWKVVDGVLICSGSPAGYIRTEQDYTSFVLRLQWRWNPETKQAGNSGVLLRVVGEDKVWPKSVEAQLHSGNAGDFWNIGGFGMTTDPARTNGRNTKKLAMAENPVGEWNDYEIIVDGGTVTLRVNGQLVNEATDVDEVAGAIALQSEGTEIHFRAIRLAGIR